ncbi:CDP-diacylglycerol--serine O-phosphatidyltransferase [Paludibacter sp. 221]|nr:CDP-diacylglycerol--serine O-phosphatidyltransferase [Paludibacter sp. 221]NDV45911.1 CDP-diacylglycerol--serine O-phosphatidyltransferase [Paludibacter sp. 221]
MKHIPNFITSLNLFVGCIAVYLGFQGNYGWAFFFILLAAVFDFLDGFAARLLKAYSAIGKELDSLADVVSFGLAPGAMAFSVLQQTELHYILPFAAFLIPVFSALRLAKFNVDERQTTSFLGLPVPANAIFWGGAIYTFYDFFVFQPWVLCALILLFCALLVSEIPMFSLKMSGFSWKKYKTQYIFILGCVALLVSLWDNAFAPIIAWYIFYSVLIYIIYPKKAPTK